MRLTKLKIAGFKSFVDPTTVSFPSSLTGVVGPNGCGKSNIIDAVRWVMGEISAKHLRGESMADVIFNGSSARKPLGAASVELIFDNSEGKISGQYANYNEVSLRRTVSRDGTSDYFINGVKVRRKDITQLFLGTGVGSRSYAIIEQGMISRIIEARPDDLRAFLEEAAGISRYKERRRETESRIAHTRENLDRLNDLREEVDKQIRHLQRQAATARRYQVLREEQRKLQAELLALRLRGLDAEGATREATVRQADAAIQAAIADLRESEARIERVRAAQGARSDALGAIQGRYYEAGSEVSKIEQNIQYTRELRQRQKNDLEQVGAQARELAESNQRDRGRIAALSGELLLMVPALDGAHTDESAAAAAREKSEQALAGWQLAWNSYAESVALWERETQVERARIEQLDGEQRRLLLQGQRQGEEHAQLVGAAPAVPLAMLEEEAAQAEAAGRRSQAELQELLEELAQARERERALTKRVADARARWQDAVSTQVSTEALQQAALGRASGMVAQWLQAQALDQQPRLAQQLRVERGWERAVETVLGSYLEAVSVAAFEDVAGKLADFDGGHLVLVEGREAAAAPAATESLLSKVRGAAVLESLLAAVFPAATLQEALARRSGLAPGESLVTRDGIWLGRDWLRVARDHDVRSGVIEREESLREICGQVERLAEELADLERQQSGARDRVSEQEDQRERLQGEVNRLHREHLDRRSARDTARLRAEDAARRLEQLATGLQDVRQELERTDVELRAARGRMQSAIDTLASLRPARSELESRRDRLREGLAATRAAAAAAQQTARDLALQVQSRRSTHDSLVAGLARVDDQLAAIERRRGDLAAQLAEGDAPLVALQSDLDGALQRRSAVETELHAARLAADELEAQLRDLDRDRGANDDRVENARRALDEARLAAEQVRVRRESIAEQLATTSFEAAALLAQLPMEATAEAWDATLAETVAKIERLGQVNLAAIDEFKEQSERKEYLDRQNKDLTDALETLESAMRKIDRETRTRFQDTFDRVNAGLKEKFPRLFGGGHAYLELAGEDASAAGVSVMARPPGKRNSTISQLSGGEKALTAVALVFAIFDLNPAPFCLLDEVDAPLDENNVGRFCDIVRDMSAAVQFIFITHNKTTMELASQLVGVTMNEPGVSRLVSVDVDEAVRMAAM
ncbi:MAG TPA: chromosome segregation protein SMC [Steroidobacteraceae bacterium]|nr:chromosome segregation protein SMC [Steroidobacteraceae bacterium]